MKPIFLAIILSTGVLTSPAFVQPAFAQTQTEAIQDMASWMQSAMTIQTDMMDLFSADAMSNMYSVINAEDVAAMQRFGQHFEAERQAVLARARLQIENLSPPEKWNINRSLFSNQDKAIYKAAQKQYQSLKETYSLFDTLTKSLSDILINPDGLDDTALESLVDVQYQASVRLIELENEQVDGYLDAIPKNNPNHQFQKIVKQFNLAAIPEMNITMLATDLNERQAYAKAMGIELEKIRPLIRKGRKNATTEIKKIRRLEGQNMSAADRKMMPVIIKLYEGFNEAFAVEAKMLDAMRRSHKLYLSDKSDEEIEPYIEENDLIYFGLLETRAELMQYRLSLLQ
jgi:hypothetical protein